MSGDFTKAFGRTSPFGGPRHQKQSSAGEYGFYRDPVTGLDLSDPTTHPSIMQSSSTSPPPSQGRPSTVSRDERYTQRQTPPRLAPSDTSKSPIKAPPGFALSSSTNTSGQPAFDPTGFPAPFSPEVQPVGVIGGGLGGVRRSHSVSAVQFGKMGYGTSNQQHLHRGRTVHARSSHLRDEIPFQSFQGPTAPRLQPPFQESGFQVLNRPTQNSLSAIVNDDGNDWEQAMMQQQLEGRNHAGASSNSNPWEPPTSATYGFGHSRTASGSEYADTSGNTSESLHLDLTAKERAFRLPSWGTSPIRPPNYRPDFNATEEEQPKGSMALYEDGDANGAPTSYSHFRTLSGGASGANNFEGQPRKLTLDTNLNSITQGLSQMSVGNVPPRNAVSPDMLSSPIDQISSPSRQGPGMSWATVARTPSGRKPQPPPLMTNPEVLNGPHMAPLSANNAALSPLSPTYGGGAFSNKAFSAAATQWPAKSQIAGNLPTGVNRHDLPNGAQQILTNGNAGYSMQIPAIPSAALGLAGSPPSAQSMRRPQVGLVGDDNVTALMTSKGYNPRRFDVKPIHARFFVIKSYTEDDVHKSLKFDIWASTEIGNRRLDKAFRESSDKGPIYLFFSVNASGHFCGMAEMLTPVDYTQTSHVWAQDKWKGVFRVRWVFVKDIPNGQLRHIRVVNNENKPVTNSRDTQELLPEAGRDMLSIFFNYRSKTSILDDFGYYDQRAEEMQSLSGPDSVSPPLGASSSSPPHYQQGRPSPPKPFDSSAGGGTLAM